MRSTKQKWVAPNLRDLGTIQNLTHGNGKGPACEPPLHKGQGTGDVLQNDQANANTGCVEKENPGSGI